MAWLSLVISAPSHVSADEPSIQDQIDWAIQQGHDHVRIKPGEYREEGKKPAHIVLTGLDGFTVDARDVYLISTNGQRALQIENCRGVTVRGLTVDYDPLCGTQGRVVRIVDERTIVFELDPGYPDLPPNVEKSVGNRVVLHDPETGLVKPRSSSIGVRDIRRVADRRYQISNWRPEPVEVGDLISLWIVKGQGWLTVLIDQSAECTLEDVTFHSTPPGWTVRESKSDRITYRRLRLTPGEKPEGATRPRLRASHADGIHSLDAKRGPVIEDCLFEHLGDDAIAIRGSWGVVLQDTDDSADSERIEIGLPHGLRYASGDRLQIYRKSDGTTHERRVIDAADSGIPVQAMRETISDHYKSYRFAKSYQIAQSIRLDRPIQLSVGDLMQDPQKGGAGYVIRNNTIRDTRARGIILKASDGIVEGNTIEHASLSGILVIAEFYSFLEAGFVHGLRIVDNTLSETNIGRDQPHKAMHGGAISISRPNEWQSQVGHSDITIENNRFMDIPGAQVQVNAAVDVVIRGNTFIRPHHGLVDFGGQTGLDPQSLITVDYADRVLIENNSVVDPGPYLKTPIQTTDNTMNIDVPGHHLPNPGQETSPR